MPFNGQGVFTPKHNWTNEANAGTPILPDRMDDQANDMATGLSSAILRDGTGSPTADIPWAGFGITGLRAPNLPGDAANKTYVDTATGARSMGGYNLTNVANPVNPQDAATMAWVQGTTTALPSVAGKTDYVLMAGAGLAGWGSQLNVSVLKLVDGTDKTKQVQIDASGLTTGMTRTLAAPDKSGTLALTSDLSAANGSSMVLLPGGTATVTTAVANIDFLNIFSAAYDKYVIEIEGLLPTTTNATASLYLAKAGAADTATVYNYFTGYSATVTSSSAIVLVSSANFSTIASGGLTASIGIMNANDAVRAKGITVRGAYYGSTGPAWNVCAIDGAYQSANTVTGFRLACSSNFAAGTVRVYGIKNS